MLRRTGLVCQQCLQYNWMALKRSLELAVGCVGVDMPWPAYVCAAVRTRLDSRALVAVYRYTRASRQGERSVVPTCEESPVRWFTVFSIKLPSLEGVLSH